MSGTISIAPPLGKFPLSRYMYVVSREPRFLCVENCTLKQVLSTRPLFFSLLFKNISEISWICSSIASGVIYVHIHLLLYFRERGRLTESHHSAIRPSKKFLVRHHVRETCRGSEGERGGHREEVTQSTAKSSMKFHFLVFVALLWCQGSNLKLHLH